MLERDLNALPLRDLIELLTRVLEGRDELAEHRQSGLRLAQYVYYVGEPVIQDLVGVADWRDVEEADSAQFTSHFAERLVQAGTCDSCRTEIVSYSKSAKCPVCAANVECT